MAETYNIVEKMVIAIPTYREKSRFLDSASLAMGNSIAGFLNAEQSRLTLEFKDGV
jgi:hypothetical protein